MDETKKTIYTGAQSDHCQEDRCCWLACPSRLCSELIKAADGGQISLDWFDNDDSLSHPDPATRPTVLLLPGLTGTSRESYILHMVQQSRDLGYRWVVSGWIAWLTQRTDNFSALCSNLLSTDCRFHVQIKWKNFHWLSWLQSKICNQFCSAFARFFYTFI